DREGNTDHGIERHAPARGQFASVESRGGQVLPVVKPAPYPRRLEHQRGRADAEHGDGQGGDAAGHQPRSDALPGPGGTVLGGVVRWVAAPRGGAGWCVGGGGWWGGGGRRGASAPAKSGAIKSRPQARATSGSAAD